MSDINAKCLGLVLENGATEEEDEEENEDGGVWFFVNRGGFPINKFTWDRMYKHMGKLHPDGHDILHKVQKRSSLPDITAPQAPLTFPVNTLVQDRIDMVQKYMSELQYNHTGTQFFEIRKNRPISGLMDSAKEMIRESLPIKCLEAVILALYLTLDTPALDRFPISFKTTFNGNTYRHVVLGVYSLGKYGALGMSRRDDLMYKPLVYKSLSALVKDFKTSYEKYWHTVKKIMIGLPVSHDPHSYEHINWKQQSLSVPKTPWEELSRDLDHHAREMRTQPRPVTTSSSPHPIRKSVQTAAKSSNEVKLTRSKKQERPTMKRSKSEERKTQLSGSEQTAPPITHHTPANTDTKAYQLRI